MFYTGCRRILMSLIPAKSLPSNAVIGGRNPVMFIYYNMLTMKANY